MKRILAVVLTIAMLSVMSITGFAATTKKATPAPKKATTTTKKAMTKEQALKPLIADLEEYKVGYAAGKIAFNHKGNVKTYPDIVKAGVTYYEFCTLPGDGSISADYYVSSANSKLYTAVIDPKTKKSTLGEVADTTWMTEDFGSEGGH
jgi:hypothetical protein